MSGLRGLIGRANKSSSFASSPSQTLEGGGAGAAPLSTTAFSEATPPWPRLGVAETLVAGGESDVIEGGARGALFATIGVPS